MPRETKFVEHQVNTDYGQYLQQKQEGSAAPAPYAPYGMATASDPKNWDPNTKTFKSAEEVLLPIQGPANWSQIWTNYESIGEDYKLEIPEGVPLLPHEFQYLKTSGEKLENIEFFERLGRGGFGIVWRVEAVVKDHRRRGLASEHQILACKVVRLEGIGDLHFDVSNAISDMTNLLFLNHPNIVGFFDIINIPDRETAFPFTRILVFMELCAGDLHKIMDRQPDGVDEVLCAQMLRQVAKGLQYLHSKKVAHLDIKPGNILFKFVGQDIAFKLADFGLSMLFSEEQRMTTLSVGTGTEGFMSPEMAVAHQLPIDTEPCDVYSLGMTLASALMGEYNFCVNGEQYGWNLRSTIFRPLAKNRLPEPRAIIARPISRGMAALVYHMIRVNPRNRVSISYLLNHPMLQ
ncbi:unnamed protein product [Oppiella nova]|uniref:Protein kinase domain-containing protein n=1 Tax=Oppiella nova TaxID=334625 RepID=A0A7R9LRI8_9ACAR|nr:unnamed protein product [Oppiella nova]CAG2165908.1 unnamed protein product [Oppiella nova]